MNVYDFDRTIYDGNSWFDFYMFCLKKNPSIIKYAFLYIPEHFKYKKNIISKSTAKETLFAFVSDMDNIEDLVREFWFFHSDKIKPIYYFQQHKSTDLVISASPRFLLEPICEYYQIKHLIASEVSSKTGKFIDNNVYCYGEEKVKYFKKFYPNKTINLFFSDSETDKPLAKLAKKAFLVKGDKISEWKL